MIQFIKTFLIYQLIFISCANKQSEMVVSSSDKLTYDLSNPSQIIYLPKSLEEVSGLTHWEHDTIACVNDEKGNIYFFDLSTEEITLKYDFGKNDDYEGIERVDETIYVTNSSGDLFEINDSLSDSEQVVI